MRCLLVALLLASAPVMATEPAQADYMLNCQGCHLPDGRGFPERQVPDLREQMGRFLTVPGGREYLVQVPGSAQTALDDEGLARVLNWMLNNFSAAQVPQNFQPYTAAEVGQLRQHPLTNPSSIRVELLVQIARQEQTQPAGGLPHE